MGAPASYWYVNSDNVIRCRIEDFVTGDQVTSGITVTADVRRDGVLIPSGSAISLSYQSAQRLYRGDPIAGCWYAVVLAANITALGTYTVLVQAYSSGIKIHEQTITYQCVADKGQG